MYYEQVDKINKEIDRTRKAVITLGCSFVQGMGAYNEEIWQKYEWEKTFGNRFKPILNDRQKKELIDKYESLLLINNEIVFEAMEYENSFGSVLCKKYLDNQFVNINLGIRGCGNRATIKELYLHPELNWHNIDKIIVVYCPSGLERFDFVNDFYRSHDHWIAMWPNPQDASGSRNLLWKGYKEVIYSEKSAIIEQIVNVQELLLWCEQHNAELIITPGFDRRYNKETFTQELFKTYLRDENGEVKKITSEVDIQDIPCRKELENLIELWPWNKMFAPNGFDTFVDFIMEKEFGSDWQEHWFWSYFGSGTPNGWLTKCAHPSAKAHEAFAQQIYQHLKSKSLD